MKPPSPPPLGLNSSKYLSMGTASMMSDTKMPVRVKGRSCQWVAAMNDLRGGVQGASTLCIFAGMRHQLQMDAGGLMSGRSVCSTADTI